ncbi:dynamin family protein [Phormidium sp. FACHB-592]|uniref:Dynamin family protein n=1 Tax=Stenomitos frigidus AS-A4 TaxID=2933935 RepID=A0ABV0KN41_9CYAN|nr:dynamin family protein [Phormidium sp. FACHB-592]MBD2076980.1 dynamin family protein [Phormidium sp. FACHB-592]
MGILETVDPKAIELLSRITGKKLEAREVTPPVLFLSALITVLLGVMFADQRVTEEEKQRWQKTLTRFMPAEGQVRQLTQLLSKGIREQKVYAHAEQTLTLLSSFSESERLLLIGFGYEMSAADGAIDEAEKQYLRQVALLMGLKPGYVEVLEAGFTQQAVQDLAALAAVKSLLDPARFHELETLFVKAASELRSILPAVPAQTMLLSHVTSYERLKAFQTSRKHLDSLCNQLYNTIQACSERGFLPNHFVEAVAKISRKLQSQRFRLAVVGEFSQGKSTLLNALLGEEVQPVRAIPCSGTITTLRHGERKQVLCRYKDGRQEEISIDQYKEKASIPKAAAVAHHGDALATTELEEIIFEHPALALCQSGVEILDSPGLNEHPDRTAITERLLKDTDAALFLTNASRLLPEKEKELIQYVRMQLTGNAKLPAENLFVLVNFMDLLDNEDDRHDVTQRLEDFVSAENLLVPEKNRIHYISAKAALRRQEEYLQSFRAFTQAIEHFLTVERGSITIKQSVNSITDLVELILVELQQAEKLLDGEVSLSKAESQKVLEQIGEASGRDVKLQLLSEQVFDSVIEKTEESWDQWVEGLDERLAEKAEQWSSEHSALWSRDQLIADYAKQFNNDLSAELNEWIEKQLKQVILQPSLVGLDAEIKKELSAIQAGIEDIDVLKKAQSSNWVFYKDDNVALGDFGFLGNLGLAGLGVAVFVPAIILAGPILLTVGSLVAGGLFGTGVGGVLGIDADIRAKVFENGFEQFDESLSKTFENIGEMIGIAFHERLERVDAVVARAISMYETLLEQQEQVHQKTLKQREVEKAWLGQQSLELERLNNEAATVC